MKPKPLSKLAPPFVPEAARVRIAARRLLISRRADYGHLATLLDNTPKARRRLRKLNYDRSPLDVCIRCAVDRERYGALHYAQKKLTGNDKLPFVLPTLGFKPMPHGAVS